MVIKTWLGVVNSYGRNLQTEFFVLMLKKKLSGNGKLPISLNKTRSIYFVVTVDLRNSDPSNFPLTLVQFPLLHFIVESYPR